MKHFLFLSLLLPLLGRAQNSPMSAIAVPDLGITYLTNDFSTDADNAGYSFTPALSYNSNTDPGIIKAVQSSHNVPGEAHTAGSDGEGHVHITCYDDPTKICFTIYTVDLNNLAFIPSGNSYNAYTYSGGSFQPNEYGGTDVQLDNLVKVDADASNLRIMSGGPKLWKSYPGHADGAVETSHGSYTVKCVGTDAICLAIWVY